MTVTSAPSGVTAPATGSTADRLRTDPTYQAFWLLRIGFTVAPVLFGLDKFAHVLTNWDKYLARRGTKGISE